MEVTVADYPLRPPGVPGARARGLGREGLPSLHLRKKLRACSLPHSRNDIVEWIGYDRHAAAPKLLEPIPLVDDPEKWSASRKRLIRHLARRGRPWWKPTTQADLALVEAQNEEWQLGLKYQLAVQSGELPSGGERLFDFVPPASEAADAFDDWFHTEGTKAASALYVRDFLFRHRDQLYRSL